MSYVIRPKEPVNGSLTDENRYQNVSQIFHGFRVERVGLFLGRVIFVKLEVGNPTFPTRSLVLEDG